MYFHPSDSGHYKYKWEQILYLINDLIHFLHILKPNIIRSQSVAFSFHMFIGFFIFQLQSGKEIF